YPITVVNFDLVDFPTRSAEFTAWGSDSTWVDLAFDLQSAPVYDGAAASAGVVRISEFPPDELQHSPRPLVGPVENVAITTNAQRLPVELAYRAQAAGYSIPTPDAPAAPTQPPE